MTTAKGTLGHEINNYSKLSLAPTFISILLHELHANVTAFHGRSQHSLQAILHTAFPTCLQLTTVLETQPRNTNNSQKREIRMAYKHVPPLPFQFYFFR